MDAALALVIVALIGTLNIVVGGLFTLAVARLSTNVRAVKSEVVEVKHTVNSERTVMIERLNALATEIGELRNADAARLRAQAEASNFEAGRAAGAAAQGVIT